MKRSAGRAEKRTGGKALLVGLLVFFLGGCAVSLLEMAWKGELDPRDGNQVIVAYCQNCHVHKDIPQNQCLDDKPVLYDRPPYKTAAECWICHFTQKNSWALYEEARRTRRPEGVKQGQYKDFEKKALQEIESRRPRADKAPPQQLSQQQPR